MSICVLARDRAGAVFFILCFCYPACRFSGSPGPTTRSDSGAASALAATPVDENRSAIKRQPAAEFKEKTDNPLNDWYFSVRLFETAKTFKYLVKMQFEELRGEDTLVLPNFGVEPRPVIKKGTEPYSCIIGFLDKDDQFREYKKVYVKEGRTLRLTTLYHYQVTETPVK